MTRGQRPPDAPLRCPALQTPERQSLAGAAPRHPHFASFQVWKVAPSPPHELRARCQQTVTKTGGHSGEGGRRRSEGGPEVRGHGSPAAPRWRPGRGGAGGTGAPRPVPPPPPGLTRWLRAPPVAPVGLKKPRKTGSRTRGGLGGVDLGGGDQTRGAKGARGGDAALGALVLSNLWRGAGRGRGHSAGWSRGSPPPTPRDQPLRPLGSRPRRPRAALTSACTRGAVPGAQGPPAPRQPAPRPHAGRVAIAAPAPAGGARAAEARRGREAARRAGRGAPRFPLPAPAVPRDPLPVRRGAAQTKTPLCAH